MASPIASFILTCLLIEITPGPNMTYLALVAMRYGKRKGLATLAGIALGLLVLGLAAAYGLAAALNHSPILYQVLRVAGIGYLLWLAWGTWREQPDAQIPDDLRFFRHGLVTNLLNPKALLFYIAVLPGFVDGAAALAPQMLRLTLIYVAIATAVHAVIVALATPLGKWLQTTQRQQFTRRIFAGLLVLVAVWIAIATSSS